MTKLTVIIAYQGYPPFDSLLPKILEDLKGQTIPIEVIVTEQELGKCIKRGWLYDKGVSDAKTEWMLFLDTDMEVPSDFCERCLEFVEKNEVDCMFGVIRKKYDWWRRSADGCFMMKKSDWKKFKKTREFQIFIKHRGIPSGQPWLMEWMLRNLTVGYMVKHPIGLRLPGHKAREHQKHPDCEKAVKKRMGLSNWIAGWILKPKWEPCNVIFPKRPEETG